MSDDIWQESFHNFSIILCKWGLWEYTAENSWQLNAWCTVYYDVATLREPNE